MNLFSGRLAGAALTVAAGAVALSVFAASPATASPLFCGAGRGLTADVAIWSALDDASNSAQSMGFYGQCTIVGQPEIFETFNDPYRGHVFRAQLVATCLR